MPMCSRRLNLRIIAFAPDHAHRISGGSVWWRYSRYSPHLCTSVAVHLAFCMFLPNGSTYSSCCRNVSTGVTLSTNKQNIFFLTWCKQKNNNQRSYHNGKEKKKKTVGVSLVSFSRVWSGFLGNRTKTLKTNPISLQRKKRM